MRHSSRPDTRFRTGQLSLLALLAGVLLLSLWVGIRPAQALPLPPGRLYPWQLVGCRVVTEDGRAVGELSGIEPSPAHDLWVVRGPGREHLIPAVEEIVVVVDVDARRVVIRPPEGLLEL